MSKHREVNHTVKLRNDQYYSQIFIIALTLPHACKPVPRFWFFGYLNFLPTFPLGGSSKDMKQVTKPPNFLSFFFIFTKHMNRKHELCIPSVSPSVQLQSHPFFKNKRERENNLYIFFFFFFKSYLQK